MNAFGLARKDLPPLPPLKNDLPPRSTGADFFNGDNGLHAFPRFAPTAPTKFERLPEADHRKTHAQTARRSAGLGQVRMAGGAGAPLTGPSGAPSDAGRFDRENVLVGRRLKKLTDWLTRVIRIDAGPLHALECMGRGVKKSAIRHLETDRLDIFSRAQVLGGRGTPSCMMVHSEPGRLAATRRSARRGQKAADAPISGNSAPKNAPECPRNVSHYPGPCRTTE